MRPIDADALMNKLYFGDDCWIKGSLIKELISAALTIAPVKRAKWIPHMPGDVHACSACGFGVLSNNWFMNRRCIGLLVYHNKFRYCPNCGATMINARMEVIPDDNGQ